MSNKNFFLVLAIILYLNGNIQGLINATENSKELSTVLESSNTTESTEGLFTDFLWFLEGIANFAEVADHVLPDATAIETENRASDFNFSQYALYGLKQLVVVIKDISKFALYAFGRDVRRNSRQYSHTKLIVSDIGKIIKNWFKSLRWLFAKFMELYNYYITELLLGKCVGKYLIATYPNRSFYEYPFLIIYEVFKAFIYVKNENFVNSLITENVMDTIGAELDAGQMQIDDIAIPHTTEEISIEQNEISDNDIEKFERQRSMRDRVLRGRAMMNTTTAALETENNDTSFHSLQKCLKIYAAETMIDKIRKLFL